MGHLIYEIKKGQKLVLFKKKNISKTNKSLLDQSRKKGGGDVLEM